VLNFLGPAVGMGVIASTLAKLLWFRELKSVRWRRLAVPVFVASTLVSVAGLVIFGHDGKIATYAAMVVVCALTLWWFGFVSKSR
jgi:hypothetical protein